MKQLSTNMLIRCTFKKTLIAILGLWCMALQLQAQNGAIEGRITDNITGEPLAGANVILISPRGQVLTLGSATNIAGDYLIKDVPIGFYELIATFVGYKEYKQTVSIAQNQTMQVDVVLEQETLGIRPVVVSASRSTEKELNAPASITVLTAKDLEADAVINPVQSLRSVTGVDLFQQNVNSYNVALRGPNRLFSSEAFVMVDYRQHIVPGLGSASYAHAPLNNIDIAQIELVRGAATALYGPGVDSGVIHFISKDPFRYPGTTVSALGGSRGTLGASFRHANVINDKLGYKFVGGFSRSNVWEYDPNDPIDATALASIQGTITSSLTGEEIGTYEGINPETVTYNATGTLSYRFTPSTQFTANAGFAHGKIVSYYPQGEIFVDFPVWYGQMRFQSPKFFAQAYYNIVTNEEKSWFYRTGLTQYFVNRQFEAQGQYFDTYFNDRLHYTFGMDARFNIPASRGTVNGRNEDIDNFSIFGIYGQLENTFSEKLSMVLAGRLDYTTRIEETKLSPRVALVYKPTPSNTIRLSYNQATGAILPQDMYLDVLFARLQNFDIRIRGSINPWTFPEQLQTSSLIPNVGTYDGVGTPLQVAYGVALQGLATSGQLPPQLIALLQSKLPQISGYSEGVMAFPDGSPVTTLPNRESITSPTMKQYEVGYKGLLGDKIILNLEGYYIERSNFIASDFITPLVYAPSLSSDLATAVAGAFTQQELTAFGLSPQAVGAIFSQAVTTAIGQNPIGIVEPLENTVPGNPELLQAIINYGNINYFGADLDVEYVLNNQFTLNAGYSFLSNTYFTDEQIGEAGTGQDYSLNTPKTRYKVGLNFNHSSGFAANANYRYHGDFIADEGLLEGDSEAYNILDVGASYILKNGLRFDVNGQNILNNQYRPWPGLPKQGRMVILKLVYDLK